MMHDTQPYQRWTLGDLTIGGGEFSYDYNAMGFNLFFLLLY